jgi:glycosyltransferase involved in cell wall biosynthesis
MNPVEQLRPDVSVIVPVVEVHDDLAKLYDEFSGALRALGKTYEFVFVLDGGFRHLVEPLKAIRQDRPGIRLVALGRPFGESVALQAGVEHSSAPTIVTLASYFQVGTEAVAEALRGLDQGADLVVARRWPRLDSSFNRLQSRIFHGLVRLLTGTRFRDLTCGFRAMRREVLEDVHPYGELHHFIPLLAERAGFKVKEIEAPQRREESAARVFGPGLYLSRIMDVVTVFFLTKFSRKPLRFFGTMGALVGMAGLAILIYLALYRLLGYGGIGNRPLLLLGLLFVVFGIQSFSIGLVGEIVIFTHARDKEYRVDLVL